MTNAELAIHFFFQLAVILIVCRLVGSAARWLGQPRVVGEMIAGVLMGPSLLGLLAPELQLWLFPQELSPILYALSQLGLVCYMFLVGLEFDVGLVRRHIGGAAAVSLAGIIVPFTLGGILSLTLRGDERFFTAGVSGWEAALFMGSAMAITAFPMLARIIYERGLAGSALGTLALAAGSCDDAIAWCLLAVVLASFGDNAGIALMAIGGGIVYALVVLGVGRRLLRHLGQRAGHTGQVSPSAFALVMILLLLASWYTDLVGIYAVFGAFILGIAMPRGAFAHDLRHTLEPVTTNVLLPLFFVYSGLHTQIGLVDTPGLWLLTAVVILVACLGKGVACWLAARLSGFEQRESVAIGALMNARGLMELILLNIGLSQGVIAPPLFTIMVLMAVATTLIAAPVFEFAYGRHAPARPAAGPVGRAGQELQSSAIEGDAGAGGPGAEPSWPG
ncbi:MAG: cation:proton antiporter [Chloroflexi bacterium OHK40]